MSEYTKHQQVVGLKRLKKLLNLLSTVVEDKEFYFGRFAQTKMETPKLDLWKTCSMRHPCMTNGCAMGWASTIFREVKLKYNPFLKSMNVVDLKTNNEGYQVAQNLFRLDNWDARYLFDPYSSKLGTEASREQVCQHIQKFLLSRASELGVQL